MNDTGWFTVALIVAIGAYLRPRSPSRRFKRADNASDAAALAGGPSALVDEVQPVAYERPHSHRFEMAADRPNLENTPVLAPTRLSGRRAVASTAVIDWVQPLTDARQPPRRFDRSAGDPRPERGGHWFTRQRRRGPRTSATSIADVQAVADGRPRSGVTELLRSGSDRQGGLARWCDDLARAVRGGATLSAALRSVPAPQSAAINTTISSVLQQLDRGRSLSESVHQAAPIAAELAARRSRSSRTDGADVRLVLTVIEQCAAAGGSLADPLERAAAVLRSRDAARGEVAAQSASARLSALVLTLLPVGMLMLLLATSPATRSAIATPLGIGITTIGLALNLIGWRWMQSLVGAVR